MAETDSCGRQVAPSAQLSWGRECTPAGQFCSIVARNPPVPGCEAGYCPACRASRDLSHDGWGSLRLVTA